MKPTKSNVHLRYSLARQIRRNTPRQDRPLTFWNSYPSGTKTLKMYCWKGQGALVDKLSKLADYVRDGSRGGIIFGFKF